MESSSALQHQRLNHLHQASQALVTSSPSASAYLASELRSYAKDCSVALSEVTWRRNCASCGYALIPGWTASVKIKSWMKESNIGQNQKKDHTEKVVPRKRKRNRKSKTKKQDRQTVQDEASVPVPENNLESNVPTQNPPNAKSSSSSKKMTTTNTIIRDPRVKYTCRICDKTTTQLLYHSNSSVKRSATSTPILTPVPGSPASLVSPSASSLANTSIAQSSATPGPSTLASVSRKRAKAKKNTLSELLAKEKMRQPPPLNGSGGFGLDLMDMFKTT